MKNEIALIGILALYVLYRPAPSLWDGGQYNPCRHLGQPHTKFCFGTSYSQEDTYTCIYVSWYICICDKPRHEPWSIILACSPTHLEQQSTIQQHDAADPRPERWLGRGISPSIALYIWYVISTPLYAVAPLSHHAWMHTIRVQGPLYTTQLVLSCTAGSQ